MLNFEHFLDFKRLYFIYRSYIQSQLMFYSINKVKNLRIKCYMFSIMIVLIFKSPNPFPLSNHRKHNHYLPAKPTTIKAQ